ncbi:MAG: T9SS type A sorting domain-containing protein [candidate division Zixibacteria bacterium]|nr:T9SS type A sorting domain-containing protein [candidate division Zixibacteria bacterium]
MLDMDNQGRLFVGYVESGPIYLRLYFMVRDPVLGWGQPVEVFTDSSIGVLQSRNMAVDRSTGDVWMAYHGVLIADSARYVWMHRVQGDSQSIWQVDTAMTGLTGVSMDIEVDDSSRVHAVWFKVFWDTQSGMWMKYIVYAVCNNDIWYKQTVGDTTLYTGDATGDAPFIYMSVTTDGRVYITTQTDLYRNDSPAGENWEKLTWITFPNIYNAVAGMKVDQFERVHLLWSGYEVEFCGNKQFIYYYVRENSTGLWSAPDTLTDEGQPWWLHVDSLGDPHVVWTTWNDCPPVHNVIYANKKSGSWTSSEIIQSDDNYPSNFEFVIDDEGKGLGAYHGFKSGTLDLDSTEIYYVHSDPSGVIEHPVLVPESFQLLRSYPNPFNSSTTIEFYMPESGEVSMHVYNVLGQKVRDLINQKEVAAGRHTISWDGNDDRGASLASGIYVCQLKVGLSVNITKITIIK